MPQRRHGWLVALCALGTLGEAAAQTPSPPVPLTIEAAVERALSANPTILAARLRQPIATAGLRVASERLNPEVRVEFERETPTESYSLAVPWEAGGKRSRRMTLATAGVRTSEAELAQVVADTRSEVRRAYYGRLVAESRLALLNELQDLSSRVRDAAQQRFDAGSVPRLEVLQAQLAVADLGNQVTAAAGAVTAARVQLNALIGFPIDATVPLSTSLDAPVATRLDTSLARARTANSELIVAERRLDEQRARLALARAMQTPDITPEATITHGNEPEFNVGWRAAVAVSVPLFTRHRAGVLLEDTTLTQLTAERDAILARVTSEVTAAIALADAQQRQYARYRDEIVPQALEVERMAEDAYRLGQNGITQFLQALQVTRDTRLRALEAAAGFHSALTDLERAVGAPLP
jgi:cobalt-zinc-cadmium efflux system outer membrane protein